ncbi:MAG: hypothetical protein KA369_07025 [Spirochaetes bacterium]|nr:hypothetical protein [Spirochaetota bacterium]
MITVIIIICFLAAAALLLFLLYRRSSLARLPEVPGEIVVCEERGVAVDEKRIRFYRYNNCMVRLTDRRIVIAQKLPFSKSAYLLRFVIEYNSTEPRVDVKAMILKGYVPALVSAGQVTAAPDGAGAAVTIDIRHGRGGSERVLNFKTERAGEYMRVFPNRP